MTTPADTTLRIKDVAAGTGVAPATIRMWEQRYGFPSPARTPSGYRVYTETDVERIRTVTALRHRGLSIAEAIDRIDGQSDPADDLGSHPSIYGAVTAVDPAARPQILHRSSLAAISHAIEDELLARGSRGVVVGAFQRTRFYAPVAHRYEQLARVSDATIVFADFPSVNAVAQQPTEIPLAPSDALGNEWAVVADTPDFSACLVAWERPRRAPDAPRQFEAVVSLDARAARRAARVAARLAGYRDVALGDQLTATVQRRPLAPEPAATALTALTSRIVAYLDRAPER